MNVLVITDAHFIGSARQICPDAGREAGLGQILLRKALLRMKHLGRPPELIVLLGDMVDNGLAPGAEADLMRLAGEIHKTGIPLLAIPGNHDADAARYARVFGCAPGIHPFGDHVFLVHHDRILKDEIWERPPEQLGLAARAAAAFPGKVLVALQHHPLTPDIESSYPYMLANREAVMAAYRQAGVRISLSGHYHAGQPVTERDGVLYATVPALCEPPFRFMHLNLSGTEAQVTTHALRIEAPGLIDSHCHTELAYCATTVNVADDIRLSFAMGVQTLCLTEHTFQLYFPKEEAWSFRWQTDPALADAVWHTPNRGRMQAFRGMAAGFRGPRVKAGIEVDLRADGSLLLAPQDRDGWDLIVGAIHEVHGVKKGVTSQTDAEIMFMRDVQRLLEHPIDVLAHPFRYFARKGLHKPTHLHQTVAELLAARGVAAEINFHTNEPETDFIRVCIAHGVRIALGSDSHELAEVGEFAPHLRTLADAGVRPDDLQRVIFRLRRPGC